MTEKRLIDANECYERALDYTAFYHHVADMSILRELLSDCPTVDAVEVVRCKDCKHYDNTEGIQWCRLNSKFAQCGTDWHSFPEDGYCSYGERKDPDD